MLRDFKLTENEYGLYCIPKEAEEGIVARKALAGECYEKETIERIRSFSKSKAYCTPVLVSAIFFQVFVLRLTLFMPLNLTLLCIDVQRSLSY